MRSTAREEFEDALEFYVDEVEMDNGHQRRASEAVAGDEAAISGAFCGHRIAKVEGRSLLYVELTYISAANIVLSHLEKSKIVEPVACRIKLANVINSPINQTNALLEALRYLPFH